MSKTVRHELDLSNPPPLTDAQKAELKVLAELPDSAIDTSDIPPLDDAFWKKAVRNPFCGTSRAGGAQRYPPSAAPTRKVSVGFAGSTHTLRS